ncbi:hypothetical protein UNDYM_1917 [Undibacterium sp. YM2]|uniref:hypothetical protein n=1 Tax=Undibacterium sp. YM2 TaxID=2058625 RepID=UPI001331F15C|nr:hypothetical protein [Undibacterium sp. YM2]BBB66170.1 hypothetical protein UNDYM_1917 [Undibacterium sp. YM2]
MKNLTLLLLVLLCSCTLVLLCATVLDFGNAAKADDILQAAGEVGKGEFHADYGDVTGLASHAGRGL